MSAPAQTDKKKRSLQKKTQHHVIPKSRINGKPLNPLKSDEFGKKYRKLFGERDPFNALVFLVEDFWGGRWEFLVRAAAERSFEQKMLDRNEVILVGVKEKEHGNFHDVFENMTPRETVVWLVVYYWNGEWEPVTKAIEYYAERKR